MAAPRMAIWPQRPDDPPKAAGPIMVATPAKPISTPASLLPVIFSSAVRKWATMTVKSGVVALRIEASPLAIWVWPQTIRQKGMMLLSRPMPKKARHTAHSRGRRRPMMRQTMRSAIAARLTRSVTMVTGGSSLTATPMKKKDPPHRIESATSIAHSRASICFCIAIFVSQKHEH